MNWIKSIFLIIIICEAILTNANAQEGCTNYYVKYEIDIGKSKLIPIHDTVWSNINSYDLKISHLRSFNDTVCCLRSLLKFENDTSRCSVKPSNYETYSPLTSTHRISDDPYYEFYTISLEALFIFNEIITEESFYLASFPRLRLAKKNEAFTVYDDRIHDVYKIYTIWLNECEKKGTFKIGRHPLQNSKYTWY